MLGKFIDLNKRFCKWLTESFPAFFGGERTRFDDIDRRLAAVVKPGARILELGGADRPLLKKSSQYTLAGLDVIDYDGRAKTAYDEFVIQSAEQAFPGQYDLIYSATLIEHIKDNAATFTNIYNALATGGKTLHYFPCKNCCYAWILRLVGHKWQRRLLRLLWGQEVLGITGYETFFDRCSVPQIRALLRAIGYQKIDAKPYYRANSYFALFAPAFIAVSVFENFCSFFGLTSFASGVLVEAQK